MFKYIKFCFQKIFSAKYVRKGKCKVCGKCCRNILLCVEDEPIMTEAQFEKVKEWEKHYNNFYISGKSESNALLFTCKELDENNRCRAYFFRGLICRVYPNPDKKFLINGGKLLEGCGFYYEPDRDFKSFLK